MSLGKRIKISIGILVDIQEYRNNHVIWAVHIQIYFRDVAERIPSLIRPTDWCYPLLVFHVGASDTAGSSLRNIKRDFRALGERRS